jgi:hypothetical protein
MSKQDISDLHSRHPEIPVIPGMTDNDFLQLSVRMVLTTEMLAEGVEPICAACGKKLPTRIDNISYTQMIPTLDELKAITSLKSIDYAKANFVIINSHEGLETVKGNQILRHWSELMLVCHRSACSKKIEASLDLTHPFHRFMKDRTCMYCNGLLDEDDKMVCKARRCMRECMVKRLGLELVYKCGTCEKISKSKMSKCSVCERVYYCDRKCQRENWSQHKTECEKINYELFTVIDSNGDVKQYTIV